MGAQESLAEETEEAEQDWHERTCSLSFLSRDGIRGSSMCRTLGPEWTHQPRHGRDFGDVWLFLFMSTEYLVSRLFQGLFCANHPLHLTCELVTAP